MEGGMTLLVRTAPALSIAALYQYSNLLFYIRHQAGIQVNYRFTHGK
jgi:hypothetical protein